MFKLATIAAAALMATPAAAQTIAYDWEFELNKSFAMCSLTNTSSADLFAQRKIEVIPNPLTNEILIRASIQHNAEMTLSNRKTMQVALRGSDRSDTTVWNADYKVRTANNGVPAAIIIIRSASLDEFKIMFKRANYMFFAFDDRVVDEYAMKGSAAALVEYNKCLPLIETAVARYRIKDPSFVHPYARWDF